jgi:REP element-mobilizing transposase RayT
MWKASERFGFRVVHYSVMGNHVHLLVEANDRRSLGRGMQGLGVRIAKSLNRVMGRHGSVLRDRYHAHILRTPKETKHARHYLLTNAQHHYDETGPDPFTSLAPLIEPQTFFLRRLE